MPGIVFSKASGVNESIYDNSQAPIKLIVEKQIEAFEKESQVSKIFVEDTSTNYAEKYTYETSIGEFEAVGEGGAYPLTSMQEGYSKTLEPDTWKSSFEVTQEMIEDAKHGKIKQRASMFTLSYARTKEKFAASMLTGGFFSSITNNGRSFATTCADGEPLFDTAHPFKPGCGGANQSNWFSNVFSYDNLNLVEEFMQNMKDDDGNLLNLQPDTIIIPNKARIKTLVYDAVFTKSGRPNTADNSFNVQSDKGWNIIIWPYLTNPTGTTAGTDAWYLMDSRFNNAMMGLIWLNRVPLSVRSEIAANDNNVWKGRARFTAGFNNWRAICGCANGTINSLTGTALTINS
jgi:phage major head subunit gpT-like protein